MIVVSVDELNEIEMWEKEVYDTWAKRFYRSGDRAFIWYFLRKWTRREKTNNADDDTIQGVKKTWVDWTPQLIKNGLAIL